MRRLARKQRRPLRESEKRRIVERRGMGWKLQDIANEIGCAHSTVLRVLEDDARRWAEGD